MKQLYFIIALLTTANCFAQTERKISATLSFEANKTLYDRTATNNAGGIGFGLQTNINTPTFIKPVLEINADLFAGTKVMYMTADGKPINGKSGGLGIYAGGMLQPAGRWACSAAGGTSIYNNSAHFGIRPAVSFYILKNRSLMARTAFAHIFQRDEISREPFGYFSFSLGMKLF